MEERIRSSDCLLDVGLTSDQGIRTGISGPLSVESSINKVESEREQDAALLGQL